MIFKYTYYISNEKNSFYFMVSIIKNHVYLKTSFPLKYFYHLLSDTKIMNGHEFLMSLGV